MITVRMIQYWNDFLKKELRMRFDDLSALGDWIFQQMKADYSGENGWLYLHFPKCDTNANISEITIHPDRGTYNCWIKLIEDDHLGIIFSDGKFTAGRKHCTNAVRRWLAECEERRRSPRFNFAADVAEDTPVKKPSSDDYISKRLIKLAAKKIHEAGGCDATDDYSRGWDKAIELALDILLKETGCNIEEVLDDDMD